jgi:hypothetical protein
MPNADQAADAIENLLSVTNAYLVATAHRESKISSESDGDMSPIQEDIEINL